MRHYLCFWNKKIVSKVCYYALIQNTYNGLMLTFHTNSYILCSYLGGGVCVCGNTKKAELLILTMVKIIKKDFEMLKLLMMPCL